VPGIFISHAAADEKLADEFVDKIIRLGCNVPSELIFYSSGADTGVPVGENLNSYVRKKAKGAKLVVALITPAFQSSPFCIAELGAAWNRAGSLFPLHAPQLERADLGGVLRGLAIREMTDETALDELHGRISDTVGEATKTVTWGKYKRGWLNAADDLLPLETPKTRGLPGRLSRLDPGSDTWGQLFEGFVDAALYTADDSVGRQEIIKAIDARTIIPNRYLYSSDAGADNWVRLCEDPEYRLHRESVDYWSSEAGQELTATIKQKLDRTDFDYVSLGPGDGHKDAVLVECWLESDSDLFYYPYDVSLPLVSRAISTVRTKTGSATESGLHIKAVLADFKHLNTVSEVFGYRRSPNVVGLLGNSLGNLKGELGFLRDLRQQMSFDDLLILEVRLKSGKGRLPESATPQALHFDFGPLEHYLGLTFDEAKMTSSKRHGISPDRAPSATA
jgi:Histidine-specific methyltransferase, SAM-dependent/TIR domain